MSHDDMPGLDELLLDSTLSGIDEDASPSQIETVLRSIAGTLANADPIRRAVVGDALIRRLRRAGISGPVTLTKIVLSEKRPNPPNVTPTPPPFPTVEPWPEPDHGGLLLADMAATLRRFIALSPATADAEALWCLHTYVHDAATVSPNLCLSSAEKRCGKTRNLLILGCLVRRPLHTANITIGALTRVIDQYAPTLLMDEADTIFVNGGRAELRGILNAGLYRSNAYVLRCIGDRKQPKLCSVWCPKAIALIGRLPDTLEDRSIVLPMRRRGSDEPVDLLHVDRLFAELEPIRRKAARWALDHRNNLGNITVNLPETLHDRAQDLWRPLFAIAELAGGDWPDRARRSAVELSGVVQHGNSPEAQLLVSIRLLFEKEQTDRLSSEAIVCALAEAENSVGSNRPSFTKAQLARRLAPLGIRPTIVYRTRNQVRRGYLLKDFRVAFEQYWTR
jgi:putative DNA primase/helicase